MLYIILHSYRIFIEDCIFLLALRLINFIALLVNSAIMEYATLGHRQRILQVWKSWANILLLV